MWGYAETAKEDAEEEITMIPLSTAYLCEDCQCVGSSSVQCECGSKSLLCLAVVLNREIAILQSEAE